MSYSGNIQADLYYEHYNDMEEKKETGLHCTECMCVFDKYGFKINNPNHYDLEDGICEYCIEQIKVIDSDYYDELVRSGKIKSELLKTIGDCLRPIDLTQKKKEDDLPF